MPLHAAVINFVRRTTSAAYRRALLGGIPQATAAGLVSTGNFRDAVPIYAQLARARPADVTLRLAYAEALLGDKQYDAACAEFAELKGKGLGPRVLGLPAARACLGKADFKALFARRQRCHQAANGR